jgi:hypothetical protein
LHNVKNYKGIAFCESWKGNKTFEQFKRIRGRLGFAVLEPGRLVKLKEAFKVATSVSDIKVKDAKVVTK